MSNIGIDLPVTGGGSDPAVVALLTSIVSLLTGAERTLNSVESLADGSTPSGVQSVSIFFDGAGGTLDGTLVPDGFVANFSPNKGDDTVDAIAYTVPTAGAQKVIINWVDV